MDVSVITPIYKGNKYIPGILLMMHKNAKHAKNLDIELVLVNDSPEICLQVNSEMIDNFHVTIVNNKNNMGIHGARVQGIKAAQGKYIIMLDQDDEIVDDAIIKQFNNLDNRDAVISNGYAENTFGERKLLFKNIKKMSNVNKINFYFYFGNIIASPGMVLINKESIPKEWTENIMRINGADDWLLWVMCICKGLLFSVNAEPLYIHKDTNENTSNDNEKMNKSNREAIDIIENHNDFCSNKLLSVYSRRIKMRETQMLKKGIIWKILLYLKNPDIAFYVYRHNK